MASRIETVTENTSRAVLVTFVVATVVAVLGAALTILGMPAPQKAPDPPGFTGHLPHWHAVLARAGRRPARVVVVGDSIS